MRYFDFSSWQGVLSTLFGLAIITLLGVGICLLVMQTVQQRGMGLGLGAGMTSGESAPDRE